MDRYRIIYDRVARHWIVMHASGGKVFAKRLLLETDAKTDSDGSIVCEGNITSGSLLSAGSKTAIVDELKITREGKLPEGFVNEKEMREWCVVFHEGTGDWIAYRQDGLATITTKELEISCFAVSSEGVLHCLAEAIVDGSTHRRGNVKPTASALLRTLIVFDQVVAIQTISAVGYAPPIVGG